MQAEERLRLDWLFWGYIFLAGKRVTACLQACQISKDLGTQGHLSTKVAKIAAQPLVGDWCVVLAN